MIGEIVVSCELWVGRVEWCLVVGKGGIGGGGG